MNLHFTFETDTVKINYLDVTIHGDPITDIHTDIYTKPHARNSYLHARSSHPKTLIRGIPKGQFLRYKRLCSDPETFLKHSKTLSDKFLSRGYNKADVDVVLLNAKTVDRVDLLKKKIRNKQTKFQDMPLFITKFSKQASQIRQIVSKHWNILKLDKDLDTYTTHGPRFAFRRANTLASSISKSLYKSPSQSRMSNIPRGFLRCSFCKCCKYATPTKRVHTLFPKGKHRINTFINCQTSHVVYVITCGCRYKYVGRTIRSLYIRISEHVRLINKKDLVHPLSKHFVQCPLGGLKKFSFCAVEHVPSCIRGGDRLNRLNKKEMSWIFSLNTLQPYGLNVEWELKHFLGD
ncbi:hypothetical protein FKM82_028355 [Ascaphus truei]